MNVVTKKYCAVVKSEKVYQQSNKLLVRANVEAKF